MKNVFFVLLLSAPVALPAQCEYAINEIDAFEKVEKVLTKPVPVYQEKKSVNAVSMALIRVDTSFRVLVSLDFSKLFCANSKTQALFMLSDSSILRLTHDGGAECAKSRKRGGIAAYSLSMMFAIDAASLEKAQKNDISKIRLYTSADTIDIDLNEQGKAKESNAAFFKNTVPCILKK